MLALAAPGCSAVYPGAHPIACALGGDGSDPCLELRMRCISGTCREVCIDMEICNRVDDDCDGATDEGIDEDMDTVPGCTLDAPDCDDQNDAINPAAIEQCNGLDDDCDGMIDDDPPGGPLCGIGEACIPRLMGCVTPRCEYPESAPCPAGYVCDSTTGECVMGMGCVTTGCTGPGERCNLITRTCVVPAFDGGACNNDYDCVSERCYPRREALRISAGGGPPGLCASACCSDADCERDEMCWVSGSGARACVLRSVIEMEPLGPHGPSCATEATCGADACVRGASTGINGFWCETPPTPSDASACYAHGECRSGVCWFMFSFLGDQWGPCSGACGQTSDCNGYEDRYRFTGEALATGPVDLRCGYVGFEGTSDVTAACIPVRGSARPAGASCTGSLDCLDGACIDGTCRATCCTDTQCQNGELCRPYAVNGRWEMHCGPRLGA
jgi:hypothetical protein